MVQQLGRPLNKKAKQCKLYIIAKAKSLWAGKGWQWRPIAASPQPIVQKSKPRVAARAFTRLLKYLVQEVAMSFLTLSVTELSSWYHWCANNGFTAIVEFDGKEQFKNIPPTTMHDHLKASSEWLTNRKRWRAKDLIWSIHHMHAKMDRAGKASSQNFHYINHEDLVALVSHELGNNNGCYSSGALWVRTNCIPMGGLFSAQGADLHSVLGAYQGSQLFRKLGTLEISDEGWAVWHTRWGRVSMCQFRDNILVAPDSSPSDRAKVVEEVWQILKSC